MPERKILDFIRKKLKKGMSLQEIDTDLIKLGFSTRAINEAIGYIISEEQVSAKPAKRKAAAKVKPAPHSKLKKTKAHAIRTIPAAPKERTKRPSIWDPEFKVELMRLEKSLQEMSARPKQQEYVPQQQVLREQPVQKTLQKQAQAPQVQQSPAPQVVRPVQNNAVVDEPAVPRQHSPADHYLHMQKSAVVLRYMLMGLGFIIITTLLLLAAKYI